MGTSAATSGDRVISDTDGRRQVPTFAPLDAGAGQRVGGERERRAVPLQTVGAAVRRVSL